MTQRRMTSVLMMAPVVAALLGGAGCATNQGKGAAYGAGGGALLGAGIGALAGGGKGALHRRRRRRGRGRRGGGRHRPLAWTSSRKALNDVGGRAGRCAGRQARRAVQLRHPLRHGQVSAQGPVEARPRRVREGARAVQGHRHRHRRSHGQQGQEGAQPQALGRARRSRHRPARRRRRRSRAHDGQGARGHRAGRRQRHGRGPPAEPPRPGSDRRQRGAAAQDATQQPAQAQRIEKPHARPGRGDCPAAARAVSSGSGSRSRSSRPSSSAAPAAGNALDPSPGAAGQAPALSSAASASARRVASGTSAARLASACVVPACLQGGVVADVWPGRHQSPEITCDQAAPPPIGSLMNSDALRVHPAARRCGTNRGGSPPERSHAARAPRGIAGHRALAEDSSRAVTIPASRVVYSRGQLVRSAAHDLDRRGRHLGRGGDDGREGRRRVRAAARAEHPARRARAAARARATRCRSSRSTAAPPRWRLTTRAGRRLQLRHGRRAREWRKMLVAFQPGCQRQAARRGSAPSASSRRRRTSSRAARPRGVSSSTSSSRRSRPAARRCRLHPAEPRAPPSSDCVPALGQRPHRP